MNWGAMSRAARDAAYNNTMAVQNAAELHAARESASAAFRKAHPEHLDLRYGRRERNSWDLFPAANPDAPCIVFVHGGYWQRNAKDQFANLIGGPYARGWAAALPGYTLAPDASLTEIVAEINAALDWLAANGSAHGITGKVVLSGWSAGGHLTAMALSHAKVRAGMAISGIYDLEPIRHSYLNVKLGLDEATSRRNSPMAQDGGPMKPLSLVVGSAELLLLRKQTADFAGHRARHGLPVTYEEIPGGDHFTVMNELASPAGRITTLIRQLFERTA